MALSVRSQVRPPLLLSQVGYLWRLLVSVATKRFALLLGTASCPLCFARFASLCRCCNFATFEPNGTFSSRNVTQQLEQMSVITSTKRDAWIVISVSQEAVYSGSWSRGLVAAAAIARQMLASDPLLQGWIVDYEPSTNYSMAHAQAYGAFLGGLVKALRPVGLSVGMVSGDFGPVSVCAIKRAARVL